MAATLLFWVLKSVTQEQGLITYTYTLVLTWLACALSLKCYFAIFVKGGLGLRFTKDAC